jgi:hypothetical protein
MKGPGDAINNAGKENVSFKGCEIVRHGMCVYEASKKPSRTRENEKKDGARGAAVLLSGR